MTGDELIRLEEGDRVELHAFLENFRTVDGRPMRWAGHLLTRAADYVSTQAIYARYPNRGPVRYQRYFLIDGRTR